MGVVDPFSVARAAGLELVRTSEGLTLTDGTMELRADFGRMLPRLKQGRLQQELLVKAARTKASSSHGRLTPRQALARIRCCWRQRALPSICMNRTA